MSRLSRRQNGWSVRRRLPRRAFASARPSDGAVRALSVGRIATVRTVHRASPPRRAVPSSCASAGLAGARCDGAGVGHRGCARFVGGVRHGFGASARGVSGAAHRRHPRGARVCGGAVAACPRGGRGGRGGRPRSDRAGGEKRAHRWGGCGAGGETQDRRGGGARRGRTGNARRGVSAHYADGPLHADAARRARRREMIRARAVRADSASRARGGLRTLLWRCDREPSGPA